MGVNEQGFIMDGIRIIFGFLDKLVYSLIKWILFGIFDLANLSTNSNVFNGIYSRLYVILGIFMAFKLSFSFFQYIIDPESMTGKSEKRLSKLFTRVFVMLGALIFLPMVLFGQNGQEGMLSRAQKAFLPSLPKIIFGVNNIGGITTTGEDTTSQTFSETIEKSAEDISVFTLGGFFAPVEEIDEVCGARTYENTPPIKSLDEFSANLLLTCNKKNDIVIGGSIHTGTKYYKYSYMLFISTVVGVLIGALLLGITLSIAKRIFKLIILEVIAPIPIMSLIDPKGSKDGAFRKWAQTLLTTFGDIFMKLGIVYLIIVFIQLIVNPSNGGLFTNFPEHSGFRGTYLTILLILGLIFFAKEAPKFIKESLGFKGDGGGLLDDVKSVGKAAGLVAGSAVATAGTVGAFRANYRASKEEQEQLNPGSKLNVFKNIGSGIAGAIGHQAVTSKALMGKNGGVKAVMEAMDKRNARRASHSTLPGRIADSLYSMGHGQSLATRDQKILEANKAAADSIKTFKATAVEEAMKKGDYGFIKDSCDRSGGKLKNKKFNYRNLQAAMEAKDSYGDFTYEGQKYNVAWFDANAMASLEDSQTSRYLASEWNGSGFKNGKVDTDWKNASHDMLESNLGRNLEHPNDAYLGQSDYGDIGKAIGAAKKNVSEMNTDTRRIMHRANRQNKK